MTRTRFAPLALGLLLPFATVGARRHVTPTVILHKQVDVIRATLPGAQHYFVRDVKIGRDDLARLKHAADFEPEDPTFKFYYGTDGQGNVVGVVLFPQVNTQHGPLEVGLTIGPDGAIARAVVTKATVETKPWVLAAERAGLMPAFTGMRFGSDPAQALANISEHAIGAMPYFYAKVTARAVNRGLALYQILFAKGKQTSR